VSIQDGTQSTLERAFQLARQSTCNTFSEVRTALRREGFEAVDQHLAGSSVQTQIRHLIAGRNRSE
jgi:hypothetical protein